MLQREAEAVAAQAGGQLGRVGQIFRRHLLAHLEHDALRIVFQVSEQVSAEYLADTTELAAGLRRDGFRFALEHFGSGRDPRRLLAHLPMDYIKVDGTLMQGLSVDQDLQQRVRDLVDQAKSRNVGTIAERVEDANTMAVLWQLGIEFIQGYFVNEPESVTI